MTMERIIFVVGDGGTAIVVEDDAEAVLIGGFYAAHVHGVAVVAEVDWAGQWDGGNTRTLLGFVAGIGEAGLWAGGGVVRAGLGRAELHTGWPLF